MDEVRIDRRESVDEVEATFISNITKQEDKLEFRSAEAISLNAQDWCAIAKVKDEIIWCFFLRKYGNNPHHEDEIYHTPSLYGSQHVYERATLWVDPRFRMSSRASLHWVNISKALNNCLLEQAWERLLVSISSNDLIIRRNTGAWMKLYPRQVLIDSYPKLRKILCEDDLDESYGYNFMLSQSFALPMTREHQLHTSMHAM